jgi:serine/threonine-protein kinase/endoribonuclease IRE1
MRRPPGDGTVANTFMLALVILFIPWLVEAQRHPQGQGVRQRFDSQNSAVEADASHTLAATRLNQRLETPISSDRRKSTLSVNNNIKYNQNDESAIATVAPADPAVRAPASKPFGIQSAGLPSLQIARNLEDWEVEDFVLLATVDGKLYARDRKNGKERWTLEMDKPMVETRYHNRNRSTLEDEYKPYDEYLWIIEPSRDGVLFVYMPGGSQPGLVNTGLTMKKLVEEMAPFAGEDPPVLYAGDKKTTMITLDARTGRVLKWFGSSGSLINEDSEDPSCPRTTGLVDNDECRTTGTIILGRTEYSVAIQGTDGHAIATLKFSEWVPNNYDNDLQREYRSTMDSKYVHSSHDGSVFAYDHGDQYSEPSRLFREKFSSPVVRVFDVARPWGTQDKNPQLVVLPQPVPPVENPTIAGMQQSEIFLNHTEDGSWYAMSGKNYPLVMKGPEQAMCDRPQWWQHAPLWENLDEAQMHEALVGLHTIDSQRPASRLAISPPLLDKVENDSVILPDVGPAEPEVVSISARIQQIPNLVLGNLLDFVQNPVLIVCCIILAVIYFKDLKKWSRSIVKTKIQPLLEPATSINDVAEISDLTNVPETEAKVVEEKLKVDVIDGSSESSQEPTAKMAEVKTPKTSPNQDGDEPAIQLLDDTSDTPKPTPEKKKAHRGRRGGVKHRKGRNRNDGSTSDDPGPKPPATVEDAVRDAQNLGGQTRMLEPDMQTLPNGVSEVSDPVIRLNNLEVDTEALIGTGSNGTMVFKGKFDGRDVAVKRMLMQFYDIASQETKLLRESDDHPNGMKRIFLIYLFY